MTPVAVCRLQNEVVRLPHLRRIDKDRLLVTPDIAGKEDALSALGITLTKKNEGGTQDVPGRYELERQIRGQTIRRTIIDTSQELQRFFRVLQRVKRLRRLVLGQTVLVAISRLFL